MRPPLHKLDVQYRLALAYSRQGQKERYEAAKAYVQKYGAATVLPERLNS